MSLFKNFSDDFENRILAGELDNLSEQELQQLEAEGISLAELQKIKATLSALNEMESEEEKPSASIKENLLNAFDELPQKSGRIISMPIWITAGISIAAMFVIAFMLYNPSQESGLNNQPVAQKTEVSSSEQLSSIDQNETSKKEEIMIDAIIEEESPRPTQEENTRLNIEMPTNAGTAVSEMDMPPIEDVQVSAEYSPAIVESEKMTTTLNSVSKSIAQVESIEYKPSASRKKERSNSSDNQNSVSLNKMPNVFDKLITMY